MDGVGRAFAISISFLTSSTLHLLTIQLTRVGHEPLAWSKLFLSMSSDSCRAFEDRTGSLLISYTSLKCILIPRRDIITKIVSAHVKTFGLLNELSFGNILSSNICSQGWFLLTQEALKSILMVLQA